MKALATKGLSPKTKLSESLEGPLIYAHREIVPTQLHYFAFCGSEMFVRPISAHN